MPKEKQSKKTELNSIDRLPERVRLLARIQKALEHPAEFYRFERVVFPVVEHPHAFSALSKSGLFEERAPCAVRLRSGEEVLLRISGLLSLLRGYEENKMGDLQHPLKFFMEEQIFYMPTHQRGEIVEQREWAIEMIGDEGPVAEAEIIQIFWKAFERLGFTERMKFKINAIGCSSCRNQFRSALASYLRNRSLRMCAKCRRDYKNGMVKVLRCENEECHRILEQAPQVLDFICETCKKHLRGILEFLEESKIPYFLDHSLFIEGLWYDSFVFEYIYEFPAEGENPPERIVIAEGGRMMRAAELFYGRRLDVVGGAAYVDVIEDIMIGKGKMGHGLKKVEVFFSHLSDAAKKKSLPILEELRQGGISAEESLGRDSIKSQLHLAEKSGAKISLILGQKEAIDGSIIVREMDSGIQETIPQEKLIEFLKKRLKKS